LVKDRSRADGQDTREVASAAATGFGLTALCIAHERKYAPRKDIEERVLNTLRLRIVLDRFRDSPLWRADGAPALQAPRNSPPR